MAVRVVIDACFRHEASQEIGIYAT